MSDLSEKVVSIATDYMGPAAKFFLERQTKFHLGGIGIDQLEKKHMPEFVKWVGISSALLMDKGKAEEMTNKISLL